MTTVHLTDAASISQSLKNLCRTKKNTVQEVQHSHFSLKNRIIMKFEKEHPYMKRLDEVLKQFVIVKVDVDEVERGEDSEDYEEMKQIILDALFMRYAGETIRK